MVHYVKFTNSAILMFVSNAIASKYNYCSEDTNLLPTLIIEGLGGDNTSEHSNKPTTDNEEKQSQIPVCYI